MHKSSVQNISTQISDTACAMNWTDIVKIIDTVDKSSCVNYGSCFAFWITYASIADRFYQISCVKNVDIIYRDSLIDALIVNPCRP